MPRSPVVRAELQQLPNNPEILGDNYLLDCFKNGKEAL
jgi:hypothetical protein